MRVRRVHTAAGAALLSAIALIGSDASGSSALADDLRGALESAYRTNPTLEAARSQQRAVDAEVPIARSQGLPSLSGNASYTELVENTQVGLQTSPGRVVSVQALGDVPIYSGGAVRNSIKAAKTRVIAGRNDLRSTESGLFTQVVSTYMDVISNEAIVGLNRNNVEVLDVNLTATRDRYEIGDLTRTDLAQSEARLAQSQGELRSSEAVLAASRETYIQLVGTVPAGLEAPPPLPNMPASVEEAVAFALLNNPDLLAARERSTAAGYDTEVAGSGRLPKVSIFSSVDRTDYLNSYPLSRDQRFTSAQVGVRLSIPLFQGGLPAAQQRQAQAREGVALEQEVGAEREVVAAVRSSYQQWQAALDVIQTSQAAVNAAALGLEGVRAENSVGNRTILDILNAEQELLNTQVLLVRARRNAYVAGFNLLSAMGRAEARDLGLDGGPLYDPKINYERVRGNIFDWARDPDPKVRSTRTVGTPAQDGSIPDTGRSFPGSNDPRAPLFPPDAGRGLTTGSVTGGYRPRAVDRRAPGGSISGVGPALPGPVDTMPAQGAPATGQ
ncbi:MAG: TolC family outer membrane protein [Pseudomonadota bacterium]